MQNFFTKLDSPVEGSGGVSAPPSQPNPDDLAPWWMRYAAKGAGVIGGIVAILFGIWGCITIKPICLVSGIWQIVAGVLLLVFEAPFCCSLAGIKLFNNLNDRIEGRPVWQRAALYLVLAVPPIAMCTSLATLIGSGLIFMTAVIYGMQVLGKKAPRSAMLARASGDNANLVENENQFP